jgi:hypothetical protein
MVTSWDYHVKSRPKADRTAVLALCVCCRIIAMYV